MRCSWLIPVHNGGSWLAEAVASAYAECGPSDEVVVVDDGSTDSAVAQLQSRARLRVIHKSRSGLVAALEAGRAACLGTYIARLDADDRALPGRLACQLTALERDQTLAAVGGKARLFTDEGKVPEGMAKYVAWVNGLEDPHRELLVESPMLHPAVTFRASAVEAIGGYLTGDMPEDYDLWLRLVLAGYRIDNVSETVVEIRDHHERLTRTDSRYRQVAFDRCRRNFLKDRVLPHPTRVVRWAGRRGGRPWLRWLQQQGHALPAVIDITQSTVRAEVPVMPPAALQHLAFDRLLVSVGTRGAREDIRADISRLRPELIEGQDWWALR